MLRSNSVTVTDRTCINVFSHLDPSVEQHFDDLLRLGRLPHDGQEQRSVAVPILGSKQIFHLVLAVQLDEGVDEHFDKVDARPSDGLVEKPVFVVFLMNAVFFILDMYLWSNLCLLLGIFPGWTDAPLLRRSLATAAWP